MSDCFMLHMGYREWVTTRGHISPQKNMARWGGVSLIYMHVKFFSTLYID